MDILLTHGYFLAADEHEKKINKPYPPLGILSLSAYLKTRGFDVQVFDTTFASLSELTAQLERARPPIVGIYCNLMTKFNVLRIIAASKRIGAQVVLGGPEPPHYASEYLARGVDVVVIGEGELTLAELIPALSKTGAHELAHINGIVYRDADGNITQTAPRAHIPNLDVLPLPDRAAIDIPRYVNTWRTHHGAGSLSLICARGCPYHCTWCSHSVYGETHRRRSPDRVADEVLLLRETYQPDQLWYADDVFTIHHGWLFKYAAALQQRGIKLPFECISRADRLNDQVMDTLAAMGCYRLWIGSESGSQRILDGMRRRVAIEQVQWATRELQRRGIQVGMFIMLGYEGEDISDLHATLDHLKVASPDIFLSTLAYPIKGTAYYHQVQERVRAPAAWDEWSDRNLTVAGRYSRRFYAYTQRWMVGSVALHRQLHGGGFHPIKAAKAAANVAIGRAGMLMTQDQIEA